MTAAKKTEVAPINAETSVIGIINRAATDPNIDVGKMERLLDMYERISERQSKTDYHAALAQMQPHLPTISERGEIKHGGKLISKYALFEDIQKAIRPVLMEHGFALSFRLGRLDDKVTVTAILSHTAGHSEQTTIELDRDQSGSKNLVQAVGSSVSYGKRYATEAILNIVTEGQDDDGEKGSDDRKRDYGPDEPVPGALNKTKLQQQLREFDQQLHQPMDSGELYGLLQSYEPVLVQCKRDLPSWWYTKEGADALGIKDRIEQRKKEIEGQDA